MNACMAQPYPRRAYTRPQLAQPEKNTAMGAFSQHPPKHSPHTASSSNTMHTWAYHRCDGQLAGASVRTAHMQVVGFIVEPRAGKWSARICFTSHPKQSSTIAAQATSNNIRMVPPTAPKPSHFDLPATNLESTASIACSEVFVVGRQQAC